MITDIFQKRYARPFLHGAGEPHQVARFFGQASCIVREDLCTLVEDGAALLDIVARKIGREMGVAASPPRQSVGGGVLRLLGEEYDLWNDAHGTCDQFFKVRMSLLELLFRETEKQIEREAERRRVSIPSEYRYRGPASDEPALPIQRFQEAVDELNQRLRSTGLPFAYHNGLLQLVDDPITTELIEKPFWDLVAEQRWTNVDTEMKEALDRRDAGKGDAGFYAGKALESVIKILSKQHGWTTGTERGAANFIDNLQRDRFVEAWEADEMKHLFLKIRNPQGHGAGDEEPLVLKDYQATWAIETTMAWIKSLARRRR